MTKFARKLKRKRLKNLKKSTQKQLKKVEKSIDNMPQECSHCGQPFVNENTEKWTIKIDLNGATMTCPECREESADESQD